MASEPALPGRVRRVAAKILKLAGIALAALIVVAAAGTAFMSSRYFGAAVEAGLAKIMLESKQRTLAFGGPLEVFFWPNAGFRVGRVSLSEPGSKQEFASIESARLSVAAAPLLKGRIVVGDCAVDGLQATIVKHSDGSLNIDDLLGGQRSSATSFDIDMAGIKVGPSRLTWTDEARGASTVVSGVELSSGRLQADTAARTLRADDITLGATLGDVVLEVGLAGVSASPAALAADRVAVKLAYKSGASTVGASLTSPLAVDAQRGTAGFENLAGAVDIAHPRLLRPVTLPLRGALHAGRDTADGRLATSLDGSNAALRFKITRYAPLAMSFDVNVDRLAPANYLAEAEPHPAASAPSSPQNDLSALANIAIDGTATIGSLEIAGVSTRNIRLEIRSAQGRLDVRNAAPLRGK